ncbi:MAG: tetratricopeptide repeat protein, partial [bacterium]
MSDFIFLFFIVFVIAGLIYFMYALMSSSEKGNKDNELQITSDELVEQISILHKQKKYNIVENLAKNYLELKRSDDGVRIILTKSLYNSGKIYDAIEQAKIIIGHQPHNFEMQVFIANCYMEIEKPTKAITVLKHILDEDANNVIAIKELAQIYFKTNQKRSAIKMYETLEDFLDSNQEKVKNKIIRAEIHSEFKEFDLAIKEYEQTLEIYPEDISVKKRLIGLYKTISEHGSLIKLANEIAETHFADENGLWAITTLM